MTRRRLFAASGLLLAWAAVNDINRADRLHLEGGGTIDAVAWWIDGSTLVYESEAGTIGIPRSLVVRIERTAGAPLSTERPTKRRPRAEPGPEEPAPTARQATPELVSRMDQAHRALEARNYDEASRLYSSMVFEHPDLHVARVGYAVSEMALGQDGLAIGTILDGLAREPREPTLLELLGDLRDREERVEDALRAWREAFELAPGDRLREKIMRAERELAASRDYAFSTTSHFNVRYDGEVDRSLAREVMDYLEEQYWELASKLDHAPPRPITVVLYPGRAFRDVTQSPEWVGGVYDGKIRVPLGGLRRLDPRAQSVLLHELTHAVVHSKTRGQCPRWLHEGLAQRIEGRYLSRAERRMIMERLSEGDPEDWDAGGFSYPMALSLTSYLASRRSGGLVELLDRLEAGSDLESALIDVYGQGYARLCRGWAMSTIQGGGS